MAVSNTYQKLLILGVLSCGIGLAGIGSGSVHADSLSDAQAKVDKLNNEVSNAVVKQQSLGKKVDQLNASAQQSEDKYKLTESEYNKKVVEAKSGLKDLQAQQTDDAFFKAVNEATQSKDLSSFFNNLMASKQVLNGKKQQLDDVRDLKDQLNATAKQHEQQLADIKATKQKQDDVVNQLNKQKQDANTELKDMQTKYKAQLAEQQAKQQAQQQAVLSKYKTQVSDAKGAESSAGSSVTSDSSSTNDNAPATANGGGVVGTALSYLGVPYVWGGTTPSGFDCSGFVQYVMARNGVSLPRTSQAQSTVGSSVSMDSLKAGDLVFFGGVGSAYHVGIYIGGGKYVHAPEPGESVKVTSISNYAPSFARRV